MEKIKTSSVAPELLPYPDVDKRNSQLIREYRAAHKAVDGVGERAERLDAWQHPDLEDDYMEEWSMDAKDVERAGSDAKRDLEDAERAAYEAYRADAGRLRQNALFEAALAGVVIKEKRRWWQFRSK